MEFFLSLFITTIYAAESLLSPVPDDVLATFHEENTMKVQSTHKPTRSFGDLTDETPTTKPAVLGDSTEIPQAQIPTTYNLQPTTTPTPSPQPVRRTKKSNITIALLGDSMMDTMGPDAPALKAQLTKTFPGTTFSIKNYGVGGTNIEYAITRITNGYTYLGNSIPALSSVRPDVVVVESCGYNPFPLDNAMDKHWLSLSQAVDTLRSSIPGVKIVIGATIAPNWNVFGDGAPGISFAAEDKKQRVETIKRYLENAVNFAKSQKLPLANAYHPSLDGSGNGKLAYINPGDHIHYSDSGRSLFAQKIAGAIINHKLLE